MEAGAVGVGDQALGEVPGQQLQGALVEHPGLSVADEPALEIVAEARAPVAPRLSQGQEDADLISIDGHPRPGRIDEGEPHGLPGAAPPEVVVDPPLEQGVSGRLGPAPRHGPEVLKVAPDLGVGGLDQPLDERLTEDLKEPLPQQQPVALQGLLVDAIHQPAEQVGEAAGVAAGAPILGGAVAGGAIGQIAEAAVGEAQGRQLDEGHGVEIALTPRGAELPPVTPDQGLALKGQGDDDQRQPGEGIAALDVSPLDGGPQIIQLLRGRPDEQGAAGHGLEHGEHRPDRPSAGPRRALQQHLPRHPLQAGPVQVADRPGPDLTADGADQVQVAHGGFCGSGAALAGLAGEPELLRRPLDQPWPGGEQAVEAEQGEPVEIGGEGAVAAGGPQAHDLPTLGDRSQQADQEQRPRSQGGLQAVHRRRGELAQGLDAADQAAGALGGRQQIVAVGAGRGQGEHGGQPEGEISAEHRLLRGGIAAEQRVHRRRHGLPRRPIEGEPPGPPAVEAGDGSQGLEIGAALTDAVIGQRPPGDLSRRRGLALALEGEQGVEDGGDLV